MNFFAWIRDGVRHAVLLGVSDAVGDIGTPIEGDDIGQRLLQTLRTGQPSLVDADQQDRRCRAKSSDARWDRFRPRRHRDGRVERNSFRSAFAPFHPKRMNGGWHALERRAWNMTHHALRSSGRATLLLLDLRRSFSALGFLRIGLGGGIDVDRAAEQLGELAGGVWRVAASGRPSRASQTARSRTSRPATSLGRIVVASPAKRPR